MGVYHGGDPEAKRLLTGSHFDTVRNGGKYDGRLGILVDGLRPRAFTGQATATVQPAERNGLAARRRDVDQRQRALRRRDHPGCEPAGTTPMNRRRDAVAAAGELLLAVEQRGGAVPDRVATVGILEVPHGSINVIPGRGRFRCSPRRSQMFASFACAPSRRCSTAWRRNRDERRRAAPWPLMRLLSGSPLSGSEQGGSSPAPTEEWTRPGLRPGAPRWPVRGSDPGRPA